MAPSPVDAARQLRVWQALCATLLVLATIAVVAAGIRPRGVAPGPAGVAPSQSAGTRPGSGGPDPRQQAERLTDAADAITFDRPADPLPRCAQFAGHAEQLAGWALWLAHRAVSGGGYYLRRATQTPGRWTVNDWTIGGADGENQQYELTAFYVDDPTSAFLAGLRGKSWTEPNPTWIATVLPPGAISTTNLIVHRGPNAGEEPCPAPAS
jgi:hypothetical protein